MTTETTPTRVQVQRITPYKGAYRQELEDDPATQQADPAATQTDPAATPADGPALPPEEETYKGRYDALKAHYDREITGARTRETELKKQLIAASRSNSAYPKSEEEFAAWKGQYPDLYGMLVTAIRTEMKFQEETLDTRIQEVEAQSRVAKRDKAEAVLARLHPDFPDLRASKEFHEWVKTQPKTIQDWLYDNEDDPMLAARAIDLYKADTGKSKQPKAPKQNVAAAAQSVTQPRPSIDPEGATGKVWSMKEIERLSRKDFERFEDEIDKAKAEGRISYT